MKDVLLVAVLHTSEFKSKTIIYCYTLKLVLPNAFPGLKTIVMPFSNPSLMLKL